MEKGLAVQKRIVGAEAVEAMYAAAPEDEITSSATCPRIALGTTSPALESICVRANCSRSRCWSRSAAASHDVVNISRGQRSSYLDDPTWQQVRHVTADRAVEDRDGTFPNRVADLQPDVVIDLICFTLDSATALVERLRGETRQLPTAAPSGATAQA